MMTRHGVANGVSRLTFGPVDDGVRTAFSVGHPPLVPVLLVEADRQLIVSVADRPILAPRLLPGLVETAVRLSCKHEVAQHFRRIGEKKAEAALRNDGSALAAYLVADSSLGI